MQNEFPIFEKYPNLIYFDSAATAHKPKSVIEALEKAYREDYATVHRAIYRSAVTAGEQYNATRVKAASFLNANEDEIVFTSGTTAGINLLAHSYAPAALKAGDEILISEMEHHSNIVPWQIIAQQKGFKLSFIPMNEKGVLEWEGCITERTKIVSIAHVSNVTGTVNPIQAIAKEAHKKGAILIVDGAQAAPYLKIDVKELNCDFYVFSGHKCYGPTGVGVLFGKSDLLQIMPPLFGGGDMIKEVQKEATTYQDPPLRFEAGTPNIASVIALTSALEFIEQHRDHESLLEYATEKMLLIPGLKIIGEAPEKGPIITFTIEGMHPLDIATLLDIKNIAIRSGHLCAQPLLRKFGLNAAARVSFGLYNTREEVDIFTKALRAIVHETVFSKT